MSRQDANAAFALTSFLYGGNAAYIEDLQARYEADPNSVGEEWQAFFRSLKQNLKIKTFVGTGPNAVRIQIWTALIAMLMLKYLQLKSRLGWSLSNLVALLRWNFFTYRDLWRWLDDPFESPPEIPGSTQRLLGLS